MRIKKFFKRGEKSPSNSSTNNIQHDWQQVNLQSPHNYQNLPSQISNNSAPPNYYTVAYNGNGAGASTLPIASSSNRVQPPLHANSNFTSSLTLPTLTKPAQSLNISISPQQLPNSIQQGGTSLLSKVTPPQQPLSSQELVDSIKTLLNNPNSNLSLIYDKLTELTANLVTSNNTFANGMQYFLDNTKPKYYSPIEGETQLNVIKLVTAITNATQGVNIYKFLNEDVRKNYTLPPYMQELFKLLNPSLDFSHPSSKQQVNTHQATTASTSNTSIPTNYQAMNDKQKSIFNALSNPVESTLNLAGDNIFNEFNIAIANKANNHIGYINPIFTNRIKNAYGKQNIFIKGDGNDDFMFMGLPSHIQMLEIVHAPDDNLNSITLPPTTLQTEAQLLNDLKNNQSLVDTNSRYDHRLISMKQTFIALAKTQSKIIGKQESFGSKIKALEDDATNMELYNFLLGKGIDSSKATQWLQVINPRFNSLSVFPPTLQPTINEILASLKSLNLDVHRFLNADIITLDSLNSLTREQQSAFDIDGLELLKQKTSQLGGFIDYSLLSDEEAQSFKIQGNHAVILDKSKMANVNINTIAQFFVPQTLINNTTEEQLKRLIEHNIISLYEKFNLLSESIGDLNYIIQGGDSTKGRKLLSLLYKITKTNNMYDLFYPRGAIKELNKNYTISPELKNLLHLINPNLSDKKTSHFLVNQIKILRNDDDGAESNFKELVQNLGFNYQNILQQLNYNDFINIKEQTVGAQVNDIARFMPEKKKKNIWQFLNLEPKQLDDDLKIVLNTLNPNLNI